MSIFQKIGAWFASVFSDIKLHIAPLVVTILEGIKSAEDDGVLPAIAAALDQVSGHLSTEINTFLQKQIANALAAAVAVEGLPDSPTVDDIKAFEARVFTAIGAQKLIAPGQNWTTFGAEVFVLISDAVKASNGHLTYAVIIGLIESSFQDLQAALHPADADSTTA